MEDQLAIREVASVYLSDWATTCWLLRDGDAALKIAETYERHIDLVVTDVVMPNMGGQELATHIIRLYPEAKILYMSGYPDFAVRNAGDSTEHAEILQKPFSLKNLASKARLLLDKGQAIKH